MGERGTPALSTKEFDGEIDLVFVDKIWPEDDSIYLEVASTEREQGRRNVDYKLARALKACADYIVKSIYGNPKQGLSWMPQVLVLARTGRAYNVTLADFRDRLIRVLKGRSDLPKIANGPGKHPGYDDDDRGPIEVMTAHKAKGKEAHTVIVLEATTDQFPLAHADNQLYRPFGITEEDMLAEERRLFYVAITRAENRLMLLTETGRESPYVKEMMSRDRENPSVSNGSKPNLGEFASRVRNGLDSCDQDQLIRKNISRQALDAWDSLQSAGLGTPRTGYSLSETLHAELAWPEVTPPIAILTGPHEKHGQLWRDKGWRTVAKQGKAAR